MMIVVMVAAVMLPAMAQFSQQQQPNALQFQSTSTLQGSGSAYSSTPVLNEDGTANNPAAAPVGPRRAPTPISTEEERKEAGGGLSTPIGDAVLPLMLMAAAGAGIIALRRRRAVIGK